MAEQTLSKPAGDAAPPAPEGASVALARDDRYCIAVAGTGVQGVGLDLVVARPDGQWRELVGEAHRDLLDELAATEPLERAAARIRAARECLAKASAPPADRLEVARRDGDAVLVRAVGGPGSGPDLYVLTAAVTFTLGPPRMLATLVEPEPQAEPEPQPEPPSGSHTDLGYLPGAYELTTDTGTRQFVLRWPLTFKESANLDRSVYFTHYVEWMGRVREIAMLPIAGPLAEQMGSGRWGMVTNSSQIRVVGGPRPGDVVEARCAVYPSEEQPDETIDLAFEWRRVSAAAPPELVATGRMRTTWVELVGHGLVRPAPMPVYFREFVAARTPPGGAPRGDEALPGGGEITDRGDLRYRRAEGPGRGPLVARRSFETCLQDSNLVGNIYFSNYYVWQARLLEAYLQPLVGERYRGAPAGQLHCVQARVDHLVDVMPFEDIEVVATLEALHERGVTFAFEYFRTRPDGARQKLAHGSQHCVWLDTGARTAAPDPLPQSLSDDLIARVEGRAGQGEGMS